MENKQTAVEWLEDELSRCVTENDYKIVFRIAKIMEKEQIVNSYAQGVFDEGGFIDDLFEDAILYFQENYGI